MKAFLRYDSRFTYSDIFFFRGQTKNVCVPGINCYSCPGAIGACPLGALQNAIAASGNRTPYYVLGILLLLTAFRGILAKEEQEQ